MSSLPAYAARQADTCLRILTTVAEGIAAGTPADRSLQELFRKHKEFGSRDRRFYGDSVFTWIRWYGWLRHLPVETSLPIAWYLDGREDWPVAMLSLLEQAGIDQPFPLTGDLSFEKKHWKASSTFNCELAPVNELLPGWLLTGLNDAEREALFAEHTKRPPTWLRVDAVAGPEVHDRLAAEGGQRHPTATNAYAFESPGTVNTLLREFERVLEIQDLASQQVVAVCDPQPGDFWWDACCGSGGKSLHLLDAGQRNINLTATDRRESVLTEFKKRTRRHGLGKVRSYALDLAKPDSLLPNIEFDGVLVDAPCTGSGTWSRNPDGPWRTAAKDPRQLSQRQLRILEKVKPTVKRNAKLIYAVCSVLPEETTGVVTTFLKENQDFTLSPFPHPLTGAETDGQIMIRGGACNGGSMFIASFKRRTEAEPAP